MSSRPFASDTHASMRLALTLRHAHPTAMTQRHAATRRTAFLITAWAQERNIQVALPTKHEQVDFDDLDTEYVP